MRIANCVRCKVWMVDGVRLKEEEKAALKVLIKRSIVKYLVFDVICYECRSSLGVAVSKTLLQAYNSNLS